MYKNANKQLEAFLELCNYISIIPLSKESSRESAEIYAELKRKGEIIDDMDILIAGVCVQNGFILVTNIIKHFSRIDGIEIDCWYTSTI